MRRLLKATLRLSVLLGLAIATGMSGCGEVQSEETQSNVGPGQEGRMTLDELHTFHLPPDRRARILTLIFYQGFRTPDSRHNDPPPIVGLEDFFEGNNRTQSIAPNLDQDHPGLPFMYEKLKQIRARPDVQDVVVNIYDLSDIIFDFEDSWPGAENVHILTSASEEDLWKWADDLKADGAFIGWPYGKAKYAPIEQGDNQWWTLAWD